MLSSVKYSPVSISTSKSNSNIQNYEYRNLSCDNSNDVIVFS